MNFIKLIPIYLSSIVLSAHFLRGWNLIFALLCLLIPFILLVRKKWAVRVVQTFLIIGAFEWVITLLLLIGQRQSMGRDWALSAIILGSVAIFTLLSAFVFRAESLKMRYKLGAQVSGEVEKPENKEED